MTDATDQQLALFSSQHRGRHRTSDSATSRRGRKKPLWAADAFLYRTASIANASDSIEAAAWGILLELCRSGNWSFGRAYLKVSADPATAGRWLAVTTNTQPRNAVDDGIVVGVPEDSLAHLALTQDRGIAGISDCIEGLRAGCAVPVRYQGRVLGAFEVYTAGALPRQRGLLDVLLEAGEHLGQVMVRSWNHREALRQQQELAQVGRLASMRELARNLAHEVNQPLAAVVGYAGGALQLLERGRGDPRKFKRALEQVGVQAKRASSIIQDFRESLRREDMRHERLDLQALVYESVKLVQNTARETGVTVRLRLPPSLPTIEGDREQLQQVLMHLMHNGIEALSQPDTAQRLLEVTVDADEERVEILVRDSGPGMPDDLFPQLFTPFLTTKPHGLGMGLLVSRSIVEFHGGRLRAENNSGTGMSFHVRLPLAR